MLGPTGLAPQMTLNDRRSLLLHLITDRAEDPESVQLQLEIPARGTSCRTTAKRKHIKRASRCTVEAQEAFL